MLIHHSAQAIHILVPGVEAETSSRFCSQSLRAIFARRAFEVDALDFASVIFVLDSQVGNGDAAVDDLKSVLAGRPASMLFWVPRRNPVQIAVAKMTRRTLPPFISISVAILW